MAVQHDARALLLLGVAGVVTYVGYRAYVRQSQGHAQVEELYAFTRALDGSRDTAEVARIVLTQVRDQLRAEIGRADRARHRRTRPAAHPADRRRRADQRPGCRPTRRRAGGRRRPTGTPVLLPRHGTTGDRRPDAGRRHRRARCRWATATGVLLVDRQPARPSHVHRRAHARLFQALANHASVALSKATLVDRLRQEVTEKEHLALHDPLTGLPNRTRFNELVAGGASPATGRPPSC